MRASDYTFSQVPHADIPRSVFNRDHGYKTTMNEGNLIPFYVDEGLPGDTIRLNVSIFARLATPIVPVLDNIYADVFFFAVPNRLLWTHWVNMMGEQANPADSTSYTLPIINQAATGAVELSIYDYMGLPTHTNTAYAHSALPLRAYNKIWNEWFRDENLQNSVAINTGDGPDLISDYTLQGRGKRHDYITSCLPWPQKFVAPTVPLGGNATVKTQAAALVTGAQSPLQVLYKTAGGTPAANLAIATGATNDKLLYASTTFSGAGQVDSIYPSNLYADLTTATGVTINAMRQSFQIQKMLERDARGGTRYVEKILAHFGVQTPDARLQRSEFLGGGTIRVLVNPVVQTSATSITGGTTPKGDLAAFGVAHSATNGFTKSFTEHMTLIGLMQLRADLNYQNGLNKMWSRSTQYDFYWPALSHLGEQAVLAQEVHLYNAADITTVFGYQERWAEYRYFPSIITGQFKSNNTLPLDIWHLAQNFGTTSQVLNAAFIKDAPPFSRVSAVPSQPRFLVDCFFQIRAARPMPVYSVPGLIDHF
jgi:Capsid protein (F protein)